MFILGLTGQIGSGKSTALKIFKKLGAYTIDADAIIYHLYLPEKEGWRKLKTYLPADFFNSDQTLNRLKLASYLFSNLTILKKIEDLIHPLIYREIKKKIIKAKKQKKQLIIIEAAKFKKKYLFQLIDKLILVKCPRKLILKRNTEFDKKILIKILKAFQQPGKVDFIINNNSTPKKLEKKITKIYQSNILK